MNTTLRHVGVSALGGKSRAVRAVGASRSGAGDMLAFQTGLAIYAGVTDLAKRGVRPQVVWVL